MNPKAITRNTLFYGDNLPILREHVADESVDLIYLDPPFNSNRTYNVLFRDESGREADAQIAAFDDTWHWNQKHTAATYHELVLNGPPAVRKMIGALHDAIGENQMLAYLVMMTARLVELHRALKPTGSLYLHCDPTASHYLKIILDTIFGTSNFQNEITWKRTTTKSDFRQGAKNWPRIHDVILHYAKDVNQQSVFNQPFAEYSDEYLNKKYGNIDSDGRRYMLDKLTAPGMGSRGHPQYEFMGVIRYWVYGREKMAQLLSEGRIVQPRPGAVPRYKRYLDEVKGIAIGDTWDDIPPINSMAQERLGYPTQKPVALLERIIAASSNPGDVVLDPFCGCGTTVVAAQKLGRRWIGIDITHLSVALLKYRLKSTFDLVDRRDYAVVGEPEDLASARQLFKDDPYQFQWWAGSLVQARPLGGEAGGRKGKRGADAGVDGLITFIEKGNTLKQVLVQVKGGGVGSPVLRDLRGAMEREGAAIGVLITLGPATSAMEKEAAAAGFYDSPAWGKSYPRLQILTIEQLLHGARVEMPPEYGTFKQAEKLQALPGDEYGQPGLLDLAP